MGSTIYSALTISRWFVAWAKVTDAELSNLKLQKLLYYAQGWHLAFRGKPLFREPIEAWSHGPVVADVYHAYKHFGSSDIAVTDSDDFAWSEVDDDATQILIWVWTNYGHLEAWRLRNMTHEEPPWVEHFQQDERSIVIPVEDMKRYFQSRIPVA